MHVILLIKVVHSESGITGKAVNPVLIGNAAIQIAVPTHGASVCLTNYQKHKVSNPFSSLATILWILCDSRILLVQLFIMGKFKTVIISFLVTCSRNWGDCLDDEPSDQGFEYPVLPPGVMYDVDHQCRLQYGPDAQYCRGIDVSSSLSFSKCLREGYATYRALLANLKLGLPKSALEIGIMDLISNKIVIFYPCKLRLGISPYLKLGLWDYTRAGHH